MRGEDYVEGTTETTITETPPRAWGRPSGAIGEAAGGGNTPTCVGKTIAVPLTIERDRKHTHVRGEDTGACGCSDFSSETPPRAWGRRHEYNMHPLPLRNTPTCVGKTLLLPVSCSAAQKHPHVRGEDFWYASSDAVRKETPPRAWGRRQAFRSAWV